MNPTIQLLKVLLLADFPSGSAISYYENNLYLIGDDATHIMVLDAKYRKVDSIQLFTYPEKRIPKSQKTDFEASTFVVVGDKPHLLVLGSASREERKNVTLVELLSSGFGQPLKYYNGEFINRIQASGINEINIEGLTTIGEHIVLSNRGNQSNPKNHLVITDKLFWERQRETTIGISELLHSLSTTEFIGVSDLHYSTVNDILLITFSSESTNNSYDDGEIGHSYIGWINNASLKINNQECRLDGLINLTEVDSCFANEKIEGICVESVNNGEFTLHLVSDNDQGETKLFKVKMEF